MSRMVTCPNAPGVFPAVYPGKTHRIAITDASVMGEIVMPETTLIRIIALDDCFVAIGKAPVASPDAASWQSHPMMARATEHFGVEKGDRAAVIRMPAEGETVIG